MNYFDWAIIFLLVMLLDHTIEQTKIMKRLKSEIVKLLRPRVLFYIGNNLVRRITVKDTEKAVAVLAISDLKGYPIDPANAPALDSAPAWAIDDPSVASLNPSADGLTCEVIGQKPGSTRLSASGALKGNSFAGEIPVLVSPGDAAKLTISLGEPVPQ